MTVLALRSSDSCLIVLQGRGLTGTQLVELAAELLLVSPAEWAAIASSAPPAAGPLK